MAKVLVRTTWNSEVALDDNTIAQFDAVLRGDLIQPGDEAYESARRVYNGMIDKHPRLIARWAKDYWNALHPYCAGGAYVNFMMEEGSERVRATYRDNYDRLAAIKAKYDPGNLFRVNQNIRPAE